MGKSVADNFSECSSLVKTIILKVVSLNLFTGYQTDIFTEICRENGIFVSKRLKIYEKEAWNGQFFKQFGSISKFWKFFLRKKINQLEGQTMPGDLLGAQEGV